MAKDAHDHIPDSDVWAVDHAFRYLTRTTGKRADLAVYELTESLLAGRLSATAHHFVGGVLEGVGVVPATFWRDHLALHVVNGRAEVRPLRALDEGEYQYTLSSRDVGLLWPLETQSPKSLIEAEVKRRVVAGERWDFITKLSLSLNAVDGLRPLNPRTIENYLRKLGLWPLRSSKK